MKGSYILRDWETEHLQKLLSNLIDNLLTGRTKKENLTGVNICPHDCRIILPLLGWEYEDEFDNYHDFEWTYVKDNKYLYLALNIEILELTMVIEDVEE